VADRGDVDPGSVTNLAVEIDIPLPDFVSVLPTAPTMVTSRPSRIRAVLRPKFYIAE
jgi:hypothetical protein